MVDRARRLDGRTDSSRRGDRGAGRVGRPGRVSAHARGGGGRRLRGAAAEGPDPLPRGGRHRDLPALLGDHRDGRSRRGPPAQLRSVVMPPRRRIVVIAIGGLLAFAAIASAQVRSGVVHVPNGNSLPLQQHGAQLYAANCATCHGIDGRGVPTPRPGAGDVAGLGPPLTPSGAQIVSPAEGNRGGEGGVIGLLLASAVCAVAFMVIYGFDRLSNQTQFLGLALGLSLAFLAAALITIG